MNDRMRRRLKYTLQGSVIGAAVTIAIGFSWLGWTLERTAMQVAQAQANSAVVAALTPICVERFMKQPDAPGKLVSFQQSDPWKRREFIENGGWATMAGKKWPDSAVANACAEELARRRSS